MSQPGAVLRIGALLLSPDLNSQQFQRQKNMNGMMHHNLESAGHVYVKSIYGTARCVTIRRHIVLLFTRL
jgi:hypothetical protein